ncbi:hypothetical protein Ciccas_005352 [Cichlidogyrus casuarinus]|uniref:Uncharacterized protein n=1 Tax=Cichlidogyrus casuarinus TaxID=1844966 RepID=A0ABD2Q8Z8_9PLAT
MHYMRSGDNAAKCGSVVRSPVAFDVVGAGRGWDRRVCVTYMGGGFCLWHVLSAAHSLGSGCRASLADALFAPLDDQVRGNLPASLYYSGQTGPKGPAEEGTGPHLLDPSETWQHRAIG